jgi:hypothetical protein
MGYLGSDMFDEPKEDPTERSFDPKARAQEKADEFRMHAELASAFEGCRKFDARLLPGLDSQIARDTQRAMGRLEKSKQPGTPVLPEPSVVDAAQLLGLAAQSNLSTNDYHIHRRPGEVMILRWLTGDQVQQFYERLQAHFDAAMNGYREEEKTDNQWKQDPATLEYLTALDAVDVKMADKYLREIIRQHQVFVLSTQAADEINIGYLCDYVMGIPAIEVVGVASAPPEEPSEKDLAWYYKLFSLRGIKDGIESMCFFTFLQKTDDGFDF